MITAESFAAVAEAAALKGPWKRLAPSMRGNIGKYRSPFKRGFRNSFKGDVDVDIDLDMDIGSDSVVSITCGLFFVFGAALKGPLKELVGDGVRVSIG